MSSKDTGGKESGSGSGTPKSSKPNTPTLGPVQPERISTPIEPPGERLKDYNIEQDPTKDEANRLASADVKAQRRAKFGSPSTTKAPPAITSKGGSAPSTPKTESAKPASEDVKYGGAKEGGAK